MNYRWKKNNKRRENPHYPGRKGITDMPNLICYETGEQFNNPLIPTKQTETSYTQGCFLVEKTLS